VEKNRQLVEINTALLTNLHHEAVDKIMLQEALTMYQASVTESFMNKLREKKEKLAHFRSQTGSFMKDSVLHPVDEMLSFLEESGPDAIEFRKPDLSIPSPNTTPETQNPAARPAHVLRRSSLPQVRHFTGSPCRKMGLSAAAVKENRKSVVHLRQRKVLNLDEPPLTPLLEISNTTRTSGGAEGEDMDLTQRHSVLEMGSVNLDVTVGQTSFNFSPKTTSTERKSKRCPTRGTGTHSRLSIFEFNPATPRASDSDEQDADVTLQASTSHHNHEMTMSAKHHNLSMLQQSFLDHDSFREKFGEGVNGRSTEISGSSIDQTPPVTKKNARTIASSCFGDLTDSPRVSGEVSDASSEASASPVPEPEPVVVPTASKYVSKRKKVVEEEKTKAQKSSPKKKKSERPASSSLSSSSNSENYTTMNVTNSVSNDSVNLSIATDRVRRNRKVVSYKEPALSGKLRRDF
jgi:hypothetical protein